MNNCDLNNTYNVEINVHGIEFDNFKQKEIGYIQNIIGGSRLGVSMKFHSYGLITTDPEDKHHYHLTIEETENFNRVKTNCIVYDMVETEINNGVFDKCFIYMTRGAKGNGFYGYILYNSETNYSNHVFYIEREEGTLARRLNKTLITLQNRDKYLPYKL